MSGSDNTYDFKVLVEGQHTHIAYQVSLIGEDIIMLQNFLGVRIIGEVDEDDPNDDNE